MNELQNDPGNSGGDVEGLLHENVVVEENGGSEGDIEPEENDSKGVQGVKGDQNDTQIYSINNETDGEEFDDNEGVDGPAPPPGSEHALDHSSVQGSQQKTTSPSSDHSISSNQSVVTIIPVLNPSTPASRSRSPPRPSKIPKLNRAASRIKKALTPTKAILTPSTTTTASITDAKGSAGVQRAGLGDAATKGK